MVLLLFFSILLFLPGGLCILNCSSLHNYTVSMSAGSDSKECISGHSNPPCKSLAYLFSNIPTKSCNNVTILSNLTLSSTLEISSFTDLVVIGNGVTISCTNSSGLVFNNTKNVLLEGLQFLSCSIECSHNNTGIYPLVDYAAVCMSYSSDIAISACSFADGTGTGVIMHDVIGTNQLVDTNFTRRNTTTPTNKTSGGLIIKRQSLSGVATFILDGCIFADNGNHRPFYCCGMTRHRSGLGGGVHLHLGAGNSTSHIHLNGSRFLGNSGEQGGGLHLNQSGENTLVTVSVINSTFEHNHAVQEGGGMWLMQDKTSQGMCTELDIVNTTFRNNNADWGGGLAVYRGYFDGDIGNISVEASHSNWIANIANAGSGGYAVAIYFEAVGVEVPGNSTKFHLQANFSHCNFYDNVVRDHIDPSSVGAVQIGGTKGLLTDCDFQNNTETALFVREFGFVEFAGKTNFSRNRGIRGAAILVDYLSAIGLREGVDLNFENNYAIIDGGAIYTDPIMSDLYPPPNDDICVFEYIRTLSETPESYRVRFTNNLANGQNRSIFVGTSKGCLNNDTILLFNSAIFNFNPRNVSQVQSMPYNINLDCRPCAASGGPIEVMLGQQFYLIPSVTDRFQNPAYLFGYLQLVSYDHLTAKVSTLDNLELIGPSMISMDNFTRNNELFLRGDRSYMTADNSALRVAFMYAKPSKFYSINYKPLAVRIIECMVGFVYNESSRICECVNSEYVSCSSNFSYACIRYGYWLGDYNETHGEAIPCSGHNCWYANGHCPNPLQKCSESLPDFCQLNNNPDDLCWGSKSGIMCSKCRQNYSFTFSAVKCVETSGCSSSSTAIIMFGMVIYWIVIISFILVILNLEVRIGLGFLYGIVYYFSVLSVFTDKTVTDSVLLSIINTCIAVTQLCPRVLGDIRVCFVESWSWNLHHHLFHYVTPVFVISTIAVIILVCKYCRVPRAISLAENSPIHAICTLILLSYTAVTYTSFEILKPVKIKGELWVYVDPHLKYFGNEHLPYAIVALLFECFISLPVCLLLLFAPLLVGRVNLVKLRLQPIVDDLQACYRPEYRWFAGFYFLSRQLVYLANIIPSNSLPQESTTLHFANAIILVVHSLFQPYRLRWLNLFDTLLLIDIFFLSFFSLGWSSSFIHKIIPYLLILPPALYLLAVVVLVTGMRALKCLWSVRAIRTRLKTFQGSRGMYSHARSRRSDSNVTSVGPSAATYTTVGLDEEADGRAGEVTRREMLEESGEREPLLADSYAEQPTYVFQTRTTNNTSSSRDSTLSRFPPRAGARKTATN